MKYAELGGKALEEASEKLRPSLGLEISLRLWDREAFSAIGKQWQNSRFDWEDIERRFRNEPDRLEIAIWLDDVLCGMALATTSGEAITLRFVEGNPNDDRLKGQRVLIALEATTNYGQLRGRYEIRVEPKNDELVDLYQNVYGFTPVIPKKGSPYWAKKVD